MAGLYLNNLMLSFVSVVLIFLNLWFGVIDCNIIDVWTSPEYDKVDLEESGCPRHLGLSSSPAEKTMKGGNIWGQHNCVRGRWSFGVSWVLGLADFWGHIGLTQLGAFEVNTRLVVTKLERWLLFYKRSAAFNTSFFTIFFCLFLSAKDFFLFFLKV